jgi:4-amino-4-deoxychorismate lyase
MSAQGALRHGDGAWFDLIETMRWEPEAGFVRFERHLARLYGSARALGFACDATRIGEALTNVVGNAAAPLRVRLLLSLNGDVTISAQPYEPVPPGKVWTLRLAGVRLDSTDPLLRHKTSRRATYVQARSEFSVSAANEVILLNERGEVCEGTITNIFVEGADGTLLTPTLACGLLPGVLRAELIDEGRAREAVVIRDDLKDGRRLFVGNSLRELIPAQLGHTMPD